jgi:hypothetical protein
MSGLERNADFTVGFEPTYSWAVTRTRINDNERP